MAAAHPNSVGRDTIYALSSGRPPAAIAVMRVSGPAARQALVAIAGICPPARMATLRILRDAAGDVLDRALVLWFPAPASATGEDVAELHLHGGPAIVRAVSRTLDSIGLREAEPGEFTRRALLGGRIDLDSVEGLADLLAAETETQRREAMLRTTGVIARRLADWAARLVELCAAVEAAIDYDDSDETVMALPYAGIAALSLDIATALAQPTGDRLHDGIRVAIVGPANAGKSSLFNTLIGQDAAIVSDRPGTTRDINERTVVIGETVFIMLDTAGCRETVDPIEREGIDRAKAAEAFADLVIDLSDTAMSTGTRIAISAKCDIARVRPNTIGVSARTGEGLALLTARLIESAMTQMPPIGEPALQARHRRALEQIVAALGEAAQATDVVLCADHLAYARRIFETVGDRTGTEAMLDTMFARFCLGK